MRWFDSGDGQTPLDPDERNGLRLPAFTRGDLDLLEQANVVDGLRWGYQRPKLAEELLTIDGLLRLHRQLFGDVWSWAGAFRTTEKNLGVAPWEIGSELHKACADARFWFDEGAWSAREAAIRYHHRIVRVHPFADGNGRQARIVADLLLHHRGQPSLAWPTDRVAYIEALRAADARRYEPLVALLAP